MAKKNKQVTSTELITVCDMCGRDDGSIKMLSFKSGETRKQGIFTLALTVDVCIECASKTILSAMKDKDMSSE